jgi:uncharacterized protein DUF1990
VTQVGLPIITRGIADAVTGRALNPVERVVGWTVGLPFASWRYLSRETNIRREDSSCCWPMDGFPVGDRAPANAGDPIQRAWAGSGPAFHRRYSIRVERPVLSASELMSVIQNDPNVACPLEVARFERPQAAGSLTVGEEMKVRLPGPWNGPVSVIAVSDYSFRLATNHGHLEAGEIEFRARDADDDLVFEIESWARSSSRVSDFLYDRLAIGRELQLDMWAHFLERAAQVSGGTAINGIDVLTERCDEHPL